ncbi:UNVERIFIED_CONTAM: hypothetical protein PYX00_000125 [Menopon gallinae]|uniref:Beta-hexosaminidase n=1 Tax=Menopon gallinae TaxID=328185 RepID=A0AAW2I7S1_9NEOP
MLLSSLIFSLSLLLVSNVVSTQDAGRSFKPIGISPGPVVVATKGAVWPRPQQQKKFETFMMVRPNEFTFKVVNKDCEILQNALQRYQKIIENKIKMRKMIRNDESDAKKRDLMTNNKFVGYLDTLKVNLLSKCEDLPYFNMDEKYELKINTPDMPKDALLTSASIWGILRGLETFSQLIYLTDSTALVVNTTAISDFPRFSHRGLLLDTSRHFMPMATIYKMLDAMAMNKFNVFHWHIVDDHSFPYQSTTFPRLASYGAYSPRHMYTQENVKNVLKYATFRGIRVIAEFDTPGHTRSWGEGHPELLTKCYRNNNPDGSLGPMNPIYNTTYAFMDAFLDEIKNVFPDKFTHLGGDEVDYACWESNPELLNYVRKNNITFTQLEELYVKKVIDMTVKKSMIPIVWQEVFDNGLNIPKNTIVHVWKHHSGPYKEEMSRVTKMGYTTLLSSPWYLDHLKDGGDWIKFYNLDPYDFDGNDEQKKKVIGGEACMWSEAVDSTNVMQRVWPRAAAVAEKLWSPPGKNTHLAAARLEEHACRLNLRGIPTQPPNGPGFCPYINI